MNRRGLIVLALVIAGLGGCPGYVKTEGTSGPLAWRAVGFQVVTREINGQMADTHDFTLIVRNVGDQPIVLNRMDRMVYHPGGGRPGRTSVEGPWSLPRNGERSFPLYSYRYCSSSGGCTESLAQTQWQITFTGADAQGRPIESRFEIAPPPERTKPIDTSPARRPTPR